MKALRMRRGDYAVLAIAFLIAAACCVYLWWPRKAGATVVITTVQGEQRYSLWQQTVLTVQGKNQIRLTVQIDNGRVRVRESECPDGVCVQSGWLSKGGQTAACVPAGISLRVEGKQTVDGVTS